MATKRFIKPFGEDGLRVPIPDSTAGNDVSYEKGYTEQYGFDPVTDPDAKFVELTEENQIFHDITSNLKLWQENVFPDFITTANNGGVAWEYKKGDTVLYNGENYESLEDNNTDLPTTEKWVIKKPNDVLRAILIGLGYSGNYGFFEKGFVYREVGDLGFSPYGVAYIYAGVDLFPVTVPPGTDPSASSDYESVAFNDHSKDINRNAVGAHDDIYTRNFKSILDLRNQIDATGSVIDLSVLSGNKVYWRGYYQESDGGSNWGIVKTGDSTSMTDDGGSIFIIVNDAINGVWIEANLKGTVSVAKFGLGLDGSPTDVTQQTVLAQNCLNKASVVKFKTCAINEVSVASNQQIIVPKDCEIIYHPTSNNNFLFDFDGLENVDFNGRGEIKNIAAKQSGGSSVINTFSGTGAIHAKNSSNIHTSKIQFIEGSHGVFFESCSNFSATKHQARDQQSWAYIFSDSESGKVHGNYGSGCATDCFKFRGQSRLMTVTSNIAVDNFSDGFDLFDGFFKSTFSNNVAKGNTNFGFEYKGTPSDDYNFRDSSVTGNIAQGNGLQGASIVSVRGCTFGNNVYTENNGNGVTYDGCQENTFLGEVFSKNKQHGAQLGNTSSVSRNIWSGCIAVNNSKDNPTTYSNWYFKSVASGNELNGCRGFRGTGGDATQPSYGAFFETGSAGNKIIGGTYEPNNTAEFGGDVGAQIIINAGVSGGKQRTENLTVGTYTSGAVSETGYITVKGNDGNTYKLSAELV